MIDAIAKELLLQKDYLEGETLDSIYLGGGTPSMLESEDLAKIFAVIEQNYSINNNAEITLEANPDDIHPLWLKHIQRIGINRLSIGVQSFQSACLEYMHRCHSDKEALASIQYAQDAGFYNISIDLIFGTPTLNQALWENNLMKTIAMQIPHISCYALTVEPQTALSHRIEKLKTSAPKEEVYIEQFLFAENFLSQHGYTHYEISNYAKEEFIAIHNTNYWNQKKYLGIGPSAHSYNGYSRTWNISNNAIYMRGILKEGHVPSETEILDLPTKYNEYVMVRLRTTFGVNPDEILRHFGDEYLEYFLKQIHSHSEEGRVVTSKNNYILSSEGKLYADKIASDCFMS
jgi:oxygen-independent coproporphyrinogen-3 oxidase